MAFGIKNPDVISPTFDDDNAAAGYIPGAPYFGPSFTAKILPPEIAAVVSRSGWVHDTSIEWCVENGLKAIDILKANMELKANVAKELRHVGLSESMAIALAQKTFDVVSSSAAMDYYALLHVQYRARSGWGRVKALLRKPWAWIMGVIEI